MRLQRCVSGHYTGSGMFLIIANTRKVLSKPANRRIILGFILVSMCFVLWMSNSVLLRSVPMSIPRKLRSFGTSNPDLIAAISSFSSLKPIDFDCGASEYSVTDVNQRLGSNCAMKPSTGNYTQLKPDGNLLGGHSQKWEDRQVLERYFFERPGGTFLEMGALDGIRYSNSYYWAKHLGWKGFLIEGSPINYKSLARNRPDSVAVNAMVCSQKRKLHWVSNDNNAVGGAYELMAKSFRRTWYKHITEKTLKSHPTVPCNRLDNILQKHGIVHVDVWSLDVEGAELSVLKTVDFTKFSASVIMAEYRKDSPGVEEFLTEKSYVKVEGIGNNDVYLHPMFKAALEEINQKNIDKMSSDCIQVASPKMGPFCETEEIMKCNVGYIQRMDSSRESIAHWLNFSASQKQCHEITYFELFDKSSNAFAFNATLCRRRNDRICVMKYDQETKSFHSW